MEILFIPIYSWPLWLVLLSRVTSILLSSKTPQVNRVKIEYHPNAAHFLWFLRVFDPDVHVYLRGAHHHHRGLPVARVLRSLQVPQRTQLQGTGCCPAGMSSRYSPPAPEQKRSPTPLSRYRSTPRTRRSTAWRTDVLQDPPPPTNLRYFPRVKLVENGQNLVSCFVFKFLFLLILGRNMISVRFRSNDQRLFSISYLNRSFYDCCASVFSSRCTSPRSCRTQTPTRPEQAVERTTVRGPRRTRRWSTAGTA